MVHTSISGSSRIAATVSQIQVCAPIYPSIIHATPGRFGADRSQAIIGVQMASAYIGNCLMPPLFGVIANHTTIAIFPYYLLVILILMGYMHEALQKKTKAAQ